MVAIQTHACKLLILVSFIFLIGISYTVSAGTDTGLTTIYPSNEGQVFDDATDFASGANQTVQNTPGLRDINLSLEATWVCYPFWEWNVSQLPCNITVTNVNFVVWYHRYSSPAAGTAFRFIFMNMSHDGASNPLNQSSSRNLGSQIYSNPSATYNWMNDTLNLFPNIRLIKNFSTWTVPYPYNAGGVGWTTPSNYSGYFFSRTTTAQDGQRSITARIEENITNYTATTITKDSKGLFSFGLYSSTNINNISFATSLNTSAPVKPQFIVNYTWDPPIVNSSYPNNNTVIPQGTTSVVLKYNISNTYGNRTVYRLWFYDPVTSTWTMLMNYTRTPRRDNGYYGCSYNQTGNYTVSSLQVGKTYRWYVEIIGNNTPTIQHFEMESVPSNTNTQYRLFPFNEGIVTYTSATTSYTKVTPWANGVLSLNQSKTNADFSSRIFFEWNLSHFLPVDANITMVNMTYNASDWCGTHDPNGNWVLIPNTDGNTTNTSSAEYLFNSITTGASMQNAIASSNWFATVSEVRNKSTLGALDVNHEGVWYKVGYDATVRNIRTVLMDNITTGYDNMIFGYYIPAGGAGVCSGVIESSINTTATQRPQLYLNISYNISENNNTYVPFANNSENVTKQPTIYFNVSNNMSTPITYYVTVYNESNSTWTEQVFVRRGTNGNKSCVLNSVNAYDTYYKMFIKVVGNESTPTAVYRFRSEGLPYAQPPTNVICHDYNTTTVNISFTPFNWSRFETHTVCYYQQGATAPSYGAGTFGGNFSGNRSWGWINITGLTKSTQYTFAFWSYINSSDIPTYSMLSTNATVISNTTSYGLVTFVFRYENATASNTNELINQTMMSANGTHQLIVKYLNSSEKIQYLDWETYASNDYTMNITLALTQQPYSYEFTWNYSVNATSTEFQGQYKRLLLPYADTFDSAGNEYCTFYLMTNTHVFNQYYLLNGTSVLADQISGNLVQYSYLFDDRAGYFNPTSAFQTYSTIYKYVGDTKVIIDQRFIDSSAKIAPVLMFQSYPYIGVTSFIAEDWINEYYTNLGPLHTEDTYSPYDVSVIIYPIPTNYYQLITTISTLYGRTNGSFWFQFTDTSNGVSALMFTVYNSSNGSCLYTQTVLLQSTYNFTYNSVDPWATNITYKVVINYTYTQQVTSGTSISRNYSITTYIFSPSWHHTPSADYFNYIMNEIFGDGPFKRYDKYGNVKYVMDWFTLIFGIFGGIIIVSMLVYSGSPGLAGISGAIYYGAIGSGELIGDVNGPFIAVAILIGALAIVYMYFKGGIAR